MVSLCTNSEGRNGAGSSAECVLQWRQADAVMGQVDDRRKEGRRAKEKSGVADCTWVACMFADCM